ncbi:MAG: hypothetical protein GT600_17155 [Bacteroidales bacterium]|jgi:hypothetical protein|nr:hypothetical protein [Bacteroidales bacterium]
MNKIIFIWAVTILILGILVMSSSTTYAGYQLEEKMDVSIMMNIKWETLPDAGGNIKEQGSCFIQASGEVIKFVKEKKRRSRKQSSGVSEEINYLPQGKMKVTYKFNNKYYDRGSLCAEEEASGLKEVKGKDVQVGEPGFSLVALLGMAGKGTALQLCGDLNKIQEKIFTLREGPPDDNYMFLFTVPFRTTSKNYKERCEVPSPAGRVFGLNIALKKLDEKGMHGSLSWNARASDYHQAVVKECGGTTQFVEPSPGRKYNVRCNVTWQFGKVKPFVKIYQITENKDIDITNGETDVLVGKKVKIKAVVLPYADAGSGRWEGIPDTVISGYIANDDTGKVLKFKDYHKSEIEFFFVEGKPEGKKVTLTYTADGGKVMGKTSFRVFAPEIVMKELRPSKEITVGSIEKIKGKIGCWLYYGKLIKASPPEGEPGIIISHEIKLPVKFSGHPHLLQHVQTVKEEILEHHDIDYFQMANKAWCLDTYYPYGKMEPVGSPYKDPAPNKIQMNDTPSKELGLSTNEAHIRYQFQTYLMFIPSENPDDKSCAWIPLKVIEWDWRAGIKRMVDWRKDPPCDKDTFKILYKFPANPMSKDCKTYPEWTCNVANNKKKLIDGVEAWKKAKSEQEKKASN